MSPTAIDSDIPQLKKRKMSPPTENGSAPPAPTSTLLIKRLSEQAKLPTRGSALSAGYDLYRYASFAMKRKGISHGLDCSAESKVISAHGKALVDTQISIAVPVGTYGRVAPRSGLGTFFFAFFST